MRAMNLEKNQRGFENGKFTDLYGEKCSIQKSSLATDDAIWLGIDKPKLTRTLDRAITQSPCYVPLNFKADEKI